MRYFKFKFSRWGTVPVVDRVIGILTLGILIPAFVAFFPKPRTPVARSWESLIPESGNETIAMLLVNSKCGACTAEPAASNLRDILEALYRQTDRPRLIGVSFDTDVESGLNILKRLGTFDEIVVGNGFRNIVALHYV